MATRSRIDRLFARHGAELARLTDDQARDVLRAYEDARRQLREQLEQLVADGKAERFTAQHLRVTLAQTEQGISALERRLGNKVDDAVREQRRSALRHLVEVLREQEPEFLDAGGGLEPRLVGRLARTDGLLLHRHSIRRYGAELVERIQRELVLSQASGRTLRQTVDAITAREGSVIAGGRARVELIVRMETARAYDQAQMESMEEAAELDDPGDPDPLLKKIDEFIDARNHPFSRAADGAVADLDEDWRVPAAEVEAAAAAMKKSSKGVLWRREGSDYVGSTLPAHFFDRARRVPWRRSWGKED